MFISPDFATSNYLGTATQSQEGDRTTTDAADETRRHSMSVTALLPGGREEIYTFAEGTSVGAAVTLIRDACIVRGGLITIRDGNVAMLPDERLHSGTDYLFSNCKGPFILFADLLPTLLFCPTQNLTTIYRHSPFPFRSVHPFRFPSSTIQTAPAAAPAAGMLDITTNQSAFDSLFPKYSYALPFFVL
jgi:hypothetical protein